MCYAGIVEAIDLASFRAAPSFDIAEEDHGSMEEYDILNNSAMQLNIILIIMPKWRQMHRIGATFGLLLATLMTQF